MNENPLLTIETLPDFQAVRPEHVTPAIDATLAECRAAIARVKADPSPATWDSVVEPLTDALERLDTAWNLTNHLKQVVNSEGMRAAHEANLPKVSEFKVEFCQDAEICRKYRAIAESPQFASLSGARRKAVENTLREFALAGVDLPPEKKARFLENQKRLSELENKFSQNELDATDAWEEIVVDPAALKGVPEDSMAMFAEDAKSRGKEGWRVSLQAPSVVAVLEYCDDRSLRERVYRAFTTVASEFGPEKWDNAPIIAERLKLCREQAGLLGFPDYASLSLERKMADSPSKVLDFLRDIGRKAKPAAERDKATLEGYAREKLGLATLEMWDVAWMREKYRKERYDYSDDETKQYFREPEATEGLFALAKTMFAVDIERRDAPVWHPDAKYYAVKRDGKEIASFYTDLYARDGKESGAWQDQFRGRRARNGKTLTPVAFLVCNFGRPVGGKPAQFTHTEVTTLFHEFGHGLQHMLTRVDELDVSGTNGVEWDAVELPSQIMENFCWEWPVVEGMTRHAESGERMPRSLFDKMLAAKNYCSGLYLVRQLEFGIFDMTLYGKDFEGGPAEWLRLQKGIQAEVGVFTPPEYNRFVNTFGHIFAGGYAAGYYSYLWAEVLSADAYSAFEERGGANPETGKRFLDEVLAMGGSRPSAESFRAFRGRDPRPEAFLRLNGLAN